jgi:hypothetical protein
MKEREGEKETKEKQRLKIPREKEKRWIKRVK